MAQRTMIVGPRPNITIHAGWGVVVKGWESDRVQVSGRALFGVEMRRHEAEIEITLGLSGDVYVPQDSSVKVYSGVRADVSGVRGSVTAIAGAGARIRQVGTLVHASAGASLDIDCDNLASDQVEFSAGLNLRFCARQLTDATFTITDMGGEWQAVMGNGRAQIKLEAAGEVVLVTDQEVLPLPPDGPLGNIERLETKTQ